MTIRTIAELKTNMPIGVTGGITAGDMHDLLDTLESRTSAGTPNVQTGTAYSLLSSDSGGLVAFTGASPSTLTLPNSLPAGFRCTVAQIGAGQVTFTAASGATVASAQGLVKTALIGSGAELWVYQNTGGAAAKYWLAGDLAA